MKKLRKKLKKISIHFKLKYLRAEIEALEYEKEYSNIPYEVYLLEKNEFIERLNELLIIKKSITNIKNKILIEKIETLKKGEEL